MTTKDSPLHYKYDHEKCILYQYDANSSPVSTRGGAVVHKTSSVKQYLLSTVLEHIH